MIHKNFIYQKEVKQALKNGQPVLAMESTILAHGMPYPKNLAFAKRANQIASENGVVPATIAIINGDVHIGLDNRQLDFICSHKAVQKTSLRELPWVLSNRLSGATTVSSTIRLAHDGGISVFSTGGIGGVHRGAHLSFDISQDIFSLSNTPMVVVSAGAKAILDLPKTVEMLETFSVPVLGYQTKEFPSFYSRESGLKLFAVVKNSREIANYFKHHRKLNLCSSVLVANPVPEKDEIPYSEMEKYIELALKDVQKAGITGKEVTPYLLNSVLEKTGGRSLKTNIALALNNVYVGTKVACDISKLP